MHTYTHTAHTWVMAPLPFDETLSDALAQFRLHGLASGHSARTIEARDSTIRRLGQRLDVAEATEEQLVTWLAGLDLARSSRATYRAHLVAFFKWLRKTNRRPDNPADDLPTVRPPRTVPHAVTTAELGRILEACADPRARSTRAMVLLAAYEGLRVHEVAQVRGEDFVERLLWVDGKGGVRSSVPVHPLVAELAESMPAAGWWFPSMAPRGHVDRVSVSLAIGRAIRRAGIVGATPHGLRHHFGTQVLIAAGGNIRQAQRLLRHASIATTERYTHVADEALFRVVAGIPSA